MTTTFNEGSELIGKWITNKNTLEYLGIWEKINNAKFNYREFGVIGQIIGTNSFTLKTTELKSEWIMQRNNMNCLYHLTII